MPFPSESVDLGPCQRVRVEGATPAGFKVAGFYAQLLVIDHLRRSASLEPVSRDVAVLRLFFDVLEDPPDELAVSLHDFDRSLIGFRESISYQAAARLASKPVHNL